MLTTTTAVPLHLERHGNGAEQLLVLHGGPGASHDYLLPQMLQLATPGRTLWFYDQRGGGRSRTDDPAPITWQTHVADLAQVVDELRLEPLTLVGYSWGAMLAMLYAMECAEGRGGTPPSRLVLLDPAPISRAHRAGFEGEFARRAAGPAISALRDELAASGLRESDPAAFRQRSFELSVAPYFADPARARELTPFRVIGRVQQSVWESLGDFNLAARGELDRVQVPSLVVHGRQDPIPLASSAEAAAALGVPLVILEDCGHVPYVEQPAALFQAVEEFLHVTR